MPVHDWSRVSAGIFHNFHLSWITHLSEVLNCGLLPREFYAVTEKQTNRLRPDVLTKDDPDEPYRSARRTIAIRRADSHQAMALVEMVVPSNTDHVVRVEAFVQKLHDGLLDGLHLLLIDVVSRERNGVHDTLWSKLSRVKMADSFDHPSVLASYEAVDPISGWIEPVAVGQVLPDMPLFYDKGRYVNVPFEATYQQAWRGVPDVWKDVIEGRASATDT